MNDNSQSEPAAAAVEQVKMIASGLTDEDFQRVEPPTNLWSAIAAKMDRPANEVVAIRRTRRRPLLFGAAAVLLVALAVASGLLLARGDSENVVAEAALTNDGLSPLGSASSGKAEIIQRGTSYLLHLDVSRLPQEPSSYIEVWLIDAQVKGMISLGPFHGNGDYIIPPGVDPSKYPIVDVSLEPSDGVPTHSGVSIVRGVPAA